MRQKCKEGSIPLAVVVVSGPIRATNGGGLKASDSFFAGELWGRFGLHAAVVAPLHWSNRETRCLYFRAASGVVASAILLAWHGTDAVVAPAPICYFSVNTYTSARKLTKAATELGTGGSISLTRTALSYKVRYLVFISNKYNFIN